jgi:hypothetical protein
MSDVGVEIESQGKEEDGREFIIVKGDAPVNERKFFVSPERIAEIKARNKTRGEVWRASRQHQLKAMGVKTEQDEEVLEEARKKELAQKKPPEVAEQNAIDEMKAQQKIRDANSSTQ